MKGALTTIFVGFMNVLTGLPRWAKVLTTIAVVFTAGMAMKGHLDRTVANAKAVNRIKESVAEKARKEKVQNIQEQLQSLQDSLKEARGSIDNIETVLIAQTCEDLYPDRGARCDIERLRNYLQNDSPAPNEQ